VKSLSQNAAGIERAKLKAIGQRNKVDSEIEEQTRLAQALQGQISEKRGELERYATQYASLEKVESDQLALIEKLQNQ
jgi:intraflagellar transport protein 20